MRAIEFAKFFEFSLEKVSVKELPKSEREWFPDTVREVYMATDDQGVFDNRYFDDIKLLTDQFDSILKDYIFDDLEADGLEFSEHENYFEQAAKYCSEHDGYQDTAVYDVIRCMLDPSLIEDDTAPVSAADNA